MVGRQVIGSPVFSTKGKLSKMMMRNLMVRGGGVQVDDALLRHGWSGESPVAATVLTLEAASGVIRGSRYETRGQGPTIKFKAAELWQGGDKKVQVKLMFNDLSRLPWNAVGDIRNQTEWMDSGDVEHELWHEEKGRLESNEAEEYGVGGFSIRFTLLPIRVDKVVMYGGIIPLAKLDLEAKLLEMDVDMVSSLVLTVAMKLGYTDNVYRNGLTLDLLPTEKPSDSVGLGHLPLLESVGATNPVFPEHEAIARELTSFLCSTNPTNNVNPGRLHGIMQAGVLPTTTTGTLSFEWPDFSGTEEIDTNATVTGSTFIELLWLSFFLSVCISQSWEI